MTRRLRQPEIPRVATAPLGMTPLVSSWINEREPKPCHAAAAIASPTATHTAPAVTIAGAPGAARETASLLTPAAGFCGSARRRTMGRSGLS